MKVNPKWKSSESEMKVKWKWNESEMKWKWKEFQFSLKVKWKRNTNLKLQRNCNESVIFVCESEMKVKNFFHTFSITILNPSN